jgi:peptidoglycan/xylan/chitin deacetylase (PgdA/CDA1 family)
MGIGVLSRSAALAVAVGTGVAAAAAAQAESTSAVVLMYHRFGEEKYPATNIRLEQLDAHIAFLKDGGFTVLPLEQVVAALKVRASLPPKAIAITIDDAYSSVVTEALPRFARAGFPFTVFVATEAVDRKFADIMSWDDVRALRARDVTIGGHSHGHPHFPALSAPAVRHDLEAMNRRFRAELGAVPKLLAYPYGEAGREDIAIVKDMGFEAAFGQNSGPVYAEADAYLLPRFALNETYGAMDRFALVTNTRPLKAIALSPDDPVLRVNPPVLGFTVLEPPPGLSGVSCFGPRGERLAVGVAQARITVSPREPFPTGRARVNCTLRARGQWYWFGQEFVAGGASEGVPVHARYRQ